MEPVPGVGWGFFPLDDQLGLTGESLTPRLEEHLVHLATWMPFAHAGRMLERLTGVQVSEATVRRHTQRAGNLAQQMQDEQSQKGSAVEPESMAAAPAPMVMSADGAFVPLVGGLWAEVRTLAIGEVKQEGELVSTTNLSYASRMMDAARFESFITGELHQRRVFQAKQVAGVMDGAEWLQGLLDLHCPDAVRILDFPHAAQRLGAILETLQQAGRRLPEKALDRSLHLLKHRGPRPILLWLRFLTRHMDPTSNVHEDLAYLHKREALMQYPHYQAQGWPIGSGMVESANKLVMQARLKGPGMHWEPSHVNPMLALRTTVCNDRWEPTWEGITSRTLHLRRRQRLTRTQQRQQQATTAFLLAWLRFLRPKRRTPFPAPIPQPPQMVEGRPTASHPWKRPFSGRSMLSAKK